MQHQVQQKQVGSKTQKISVRMSYLIYGYGNQFIQMTTYHYKKNATSFGTIDIPFQKKTKLNSYGNFTLKKRRFFLRHFHSRIHACQP